MPTAADLSPPILRDAEISVPFKLVDRAGASDTTFTDSGLTQGTTYVYRVRPIIGIDWSDPSNSVKVLARQGCRFPFTRPTGTPTTVFCAGWFPRLTSPGGTTVPLPVP